MVVSPSKRHFPKTISEQRKQSKTSGQNPNIKTLPTKKKWRNCISKHTVLSSFLRKAQVSAAGLFLYISFFVYRLAAPCGVLSRRLGTANLTDVKAEITESEDVWTSAFERTDLKNGRIVGISSPLTIKSQMLSAKVLCLCFQLTSVSSSFHQTIMSLHGIWKGGTSDINRYFPGE